MGIFSRNRFAGLERFRRFALCGLSVALALLAGCYTIESHETTYPVAVTPCRKGPGGAEGELFDCVGVRREAYSGERISVGLFPGQPFVLEELGIGTVGGTALYAIWVPIGNLIVGLPTICTLLVEPFVQTNPNRKVQDGDILSFGLIGAFRWKSLPRVETEEVYRERALLDGGLKVDPARIPRAEAEDGTVVYFEYPGFRALKADVAAADEVDVVFADGTRVRRFFLSDNDENLLAFKDRDIATEPNVGARFGRYCDWKSLLSQVRRLRYAEGYADADAALRADVASLESDVEGFARRAGDLTRTDLLSCRERHRALVRRLGGSPDGG